MLRRVLTAVFVLGGSVLAANNAYAQFITFGPNGSVGIQNGAGSYTYVYPGRLNPWANLAVPGSTQQLPNGQIWQGWDGQVHGNVVDPSTGDIHVFMNKGGNGGNKFNGFIEEPAGNANKQARQANTSKSKASEAKPSAGLNKRNWQSGGVNWLNPQPEPPAPMFKFGRR
jgi:hypothetical protein